MNWKSELYRKAKQIAESYRSKNSVRGVAIGGSVARGTVWKHSDLELLLFVDAYDPAFDYFNVIDGLGVEIIQIGVPNVQAWIDRHAEDGGIRDALKFPIQAYQCRIVHDPDGLISAFKAIYDRSLFDDRIKTIKQEEALARADERYDIAESLLEQGRGNSALAALRLAVNELMLAFYWQHGILPRSQNRTVYLLKRHTPKLGSPDLYVLFTKVFGVTDHPARMKLELLAAKNDVFDVTKAAWGRNVPEFLEKACDGQLKWGHGSSILYVYKWCLHTIHFSELAQGLYDRPEFAERHPDLAVFLGFDRTDAAQVSTWAEDYSRLRSELG
ncbi:hypothetical protein B1A99_25745 [Cohnella sp. CIP 111063]|uniref:hypothetical protein n=1 Tax=unclassified Cohnella TaxID=2636738 RepID=UPI000B8C6ACF|nr:MULTISPECIES: hypothetical protein [unclassified Cohnella]OXS54732.1 hypothetical protein B1A99_25745 [Cohnella sp. CIP 111063]PRX64569.1 hypothetical protein B0G52_119108 [Cohnella sp. SGD-V74]